MDCERWFQIKLFVLLSVYYTLALVAVVYSLTAMHDLGVIGYDFQEVPNSGRFIIYVVSYFFFMLVTMLSLGVFYGCVEVSVGESIFFFWREHPHIENSPQDYYPIRNQIILSPSFSVKFRWLPLPCYVFKNPRGEYESIAVWCFTQEDWGIFFEAIGLPEYQHRMGFKKMRWKTVPHLASTSASTNREPETAR